MLPILAAAALCAAPLLPQTPDEPEAPALAAEVNVAIIQGVANLRRLQVPGGTWLGHDADHPGGMTALAAFTLVKSGVRPDDPAVEKALAALAGTELRSTYSHAAYLMLLQAVGQTGRWRARAQESTRFLLANQRDGLWGYPWEPLDMSNLQFALLGLRAARHMGLEVPQDTVEAAAKAMFEYQEENGGFRYRKEVPGATGGMTAATLAGIAVLAEFGESYAGVERVLHRHRKDVARAEAWLAEHFHPARNAWGPRSWTPRFYYAYLWAIERYNVFNRREELGGREWYREGARHLVDTQEPDGSWGRVTEDTCFALLFLRRASLSGDREVLRETYERLGQRFERPGEHAIRPSHEAPLLHDWVLAGPWPAGLESAFLADPPFDAKTVDVRAKGRIERRTFRRVALDDTTPTDLDTFAKEPGDWQVWALGTHLVHDGAATLRAKLWFSFEDGWSIWLDGERVSFEQRAHAELAEDVMVELELAPGEHVLLVLVEDLEGAASFSCRVTAPDGKPLARPLRTSAEPAQ